MLNGSQKTRNSLQKVELTVEMSNCQNHLTVICIFIVDLEKENQRRQSNSSSTRSSFFSEWIVNAWNNLPVDLTV